MTDTDMRVCNSNSFPPINAVLDHWEWTMALPYNRWIWLTGSYIIFTSGVGGMVYCIIRGPPPFGMSQHTNKLSLFALHSSQEQFVAEGLIMGVRGFARRTNTCGAGIT